MFGTHKAAGSCKEAFGMLSTRRQDMLLLQLHAELAHHASQLPLPIHFANVLH